MQSKLRPRNERMPVTMKNFRPFDMCLDFSFLIIMRFFCSRMLAPVDWRLRISLSLSSSLS